ncbi:cation transporter dimerization domain-containing protein, partial [Staphylococcus saprophyticus]|uniref:cation transporter dimerization domain-containing protein n=1 Tax=Staphylococcus saprophyticus TaxID=29385 RepID=UPI003703E92D
HQQLHPYKNYLLQIQHLIHLHSIKPPYHATTIILDLTILLQSHLSFQQAHHISHKLQHHIHQKPISSLYLHPQPLSI